jgi:hypothetical protein
MFIYHSMFEKSKLKRDLDPFQKIKKNIYGFYHLCRKIIEIVRYKKN